MDLLLIWSSESEISTQGKKLRASDKLSSRWCALFRRDREMEAVDERFEGEH